MAGLLKYDLDFQGEITTSSATFLFESASIVNITVSTCIVTIPSSLPVGTIKEVRKLGTDESVAITIASTGETFTRDGLSSLTLFNTGSFLILEKVSSTRWDIVQSGFIEENENNFLKNNLSKQSLLGISQSGSLTISWDSSATDVLNTGALKIIVPSGTSQYVDFQLRNLHPNEIGQQWEIKTSYKLNTSADDLVSFFLYDGTVETPTTLNSLPYAGGTLQTTSGSVVPTNTLNNVKLRVRFKNSTAFTLYLADASVGPYVATSGAAISNWTSYTPTLTNFTASVINVKHRRVGSNLEVQGNLVVTAVTGDMGVSLPMGLSTDLATGGSNGPAVGVVKALDVGSNFVAGSVYMESSTVVRFLSGGVTPTAFRATYPFTWASGDTLGFSFSVPITQWTNNVNLATDFQEFAYNTNTTSSNDTSSFGYGPEGVLVPTSTSQTGLIEKVVNFIRPPLPTDLVTIEIYNPSTGIWENGPLAFPRNYQNTYQYGMWYSYDGTRLSVMFGRGGYVPTGTTYGSASTATWEALQTANYRWRVRKISNGNMAEISSVTINKTTTPQVVEVGAGIIESGSNANGSYVKYSDGTMECWGFASTTTSSSSVNLYGSTSGLTYYASAARSLPATFIAQPSMACALIAPAAVGYTANLATVSTTGYLIVVGSSLDNAAVITVAWLAKGRWRA